MARRRRTAHKPKKTQPQPQGPVVQAKPEHPATILQRAGADINSLSSDDVLQLQRTAGNRAVTDLLSGNRSNSGTPAVQAKLTLGPTGDQYEQEADSMAKHVTGTLS